MPEERNRIEVDALSTYLFTPDERSAETLRSEGVGGEIHVVGDVMADAAARFAPLARERSGILDDARARAGRLRARDRAPRGERAAGAAASGSWPGSAARHFPSCFPRTRGRGACWPSTAIAVPPSITVIEPLGYLDFAALASQAAVIATDSGGLQKEAYWYGVPCVTMRPSTEWVDTVEAGANVLVDDDPDRIAAAIAGAPRCPPSGRRSTATATPRSGSRPCSAASGVAEPAG